jgi:alkaline phosphatase D
VTALGAAQESWLYRGLAHSRAKWNILASNVMLARLDHDGRRGQPVVARCLGWLPGRAQPPHRRVGAAPSEQPARGDRRLALTFVNDIHRDFDDPASAVVATEIVGTSISSNGDGEVYGPYYGPTQPAHHVLPRRPAGVRALPRHAV